MKKREKLKKEFLKGIQEEIEKLENMKEDSLSLAREDDEISVENFELISDVENDNFIQNCRFLWNLCVDRGCTWEELEAIFPDGV